MPSLRFGILAVAASLAAVSRADYTIKPDSVPLSTRQSWCTNEKQTCPLICQQTAPGTTLVNECDPERLTYGCLCGNNLRPNVSEYSLTLPYFVCQEWGNQCVKACRDNSCASDCRQNNPCGAANPKKYNITSSASATATESASSSQSDISNSASNANVIYTDTPGAKGASRNNQGSSAPIEVSRTWSLAVVLASMFVGFALL